MTTAKQIAANRLNANKSTGPRSRNGKFRSRRNAVFHGLSAETVITVFENAEEYEEFEKSLLAEYRPATTIAQTLVVRLASLLWRVRRATAIETGLFEAQGRAIKTARTSKTASEETQKASFEQPSLVPAHPDSNLTRPMGLESEGCTQRCNFDYPRWRASMAECFLRLSTDRDSIPEKVGRYEAALWRQVVQTVALLGAQQS
jgi:hypothetical protein